MSGGKGSGRRPNQVSDEVVQSNWDLIFGNKKAEIEKAECDAAWKAVDDEMAGIDWTCGPLVDLPVK